MSAIEIQARSAAGETPLFDPSFDALSRRVRRPPFDISLLPSVIVQRMLQQKLPKPSEFWLAFRNGVAVGRISANVSPVHAGLGYVGFFDVDLSQPDARELARQLLHTACGWLKQQGCARVAGPVDLSTWFTYRFLVQKPVSVPAPGYYSWEPLNPPEYPRWFEEFGMKELHAYHSQGFCSPKPGVWPPGTELMKPTYEAALAAGFRFRPFDIANLMQKEIPILHRISHAGFSEAFLFEPIPVEVFASIYAAALQRFDFSNSCIVESPNGEPVGFNFAFRDGDTFVLKTMAVLKEFQKQRLSSAMLYYSVQEAIHKGIRHFVSALVKSGANSEHHERRQEQAGNLSWRHDYALYGKELA